jgi:hypothetical protein
MERGHHDVSVAVAEQALLPALRAAPERTLVLAGRLRLMAATARAFSTRMPRMTDAARAGPSRPGAAIVRYRLEKLAADL